MPILTKGGFLCYSCQRICKTQRRREYILGTITENLPGMKDQAERKNREIDGRWLRSGIAEQVPVRNHYENGTGLVRL